LRRWPLPTFHGYCWILNSLWKLAICRTS
jgi:hypothetical protein